MATQTTTEARTVHANGIDIHYLEQGEGDPLVLLHGGVVSTNPLWTGVPIAYASHMEALAAHFRVIAPDTRGGGRTRHGGGPMTFDVLADDVAALIEALGLERPAVAGFSEGGITANRPRHPAPGCGERDRQRRRLRRLRPGIAHRSDDAPDTWRQP